MGEANFIILPIAALIPLILGFIWYHPSVMGTALATATGRSVDQLGTKGSLVKTAFIYLFSLLMAYILMAVTVHQYAIFQLFMFEPTLSEQGSDIHTAVSDFMNTYGHRHRSFFHGALHGAEVSLFFGLALLGISTFAEGLPVKRLFIHLAYFVLCGALMGGLICAYIQGGSKYRSKFLSKKTGNFDDFIAKLERFLSIVFAYTFLLIFLTISFIAFVLFFVAFISIFPKNADWILGISSIIFLLISLIVLIDFITLGSIKSN